MKSKKKSHSTSVPAPASALASKKTERSATKTKPSFLRSFISAHPYLIFIVSVLLFLGAVILSYFIRNPQLDDDVELEKPILVQVDDGQTHYQTIQAQLQKDNVVQIIAQTSGIVDQLNFQAGDQVNKGQTLLQIATNYQGANASAVQASQAQIAYQHNLDTYQDQKDTLTLNRQLVEGQYDFATTQAHWNKDSIEKVRNNLNLTKDTISIIESQIETIKAVNPQDSSLINLQSTQLQLQGNLMQTRSNLDNLEYQANEEKILSQTPEIERELSLKQIDIQEKALDLQLKSSRLSAHLAHIQASLTRPSSPFTGTVQKINVKKGDMISPGQVLAVIVNDDDSKTSSLINASITSQLAYSYDQTKTSYLVLPNNKKIALETAYTSLVPTDQNAYNLYFDLSASDTAQLDHNSYLTIELPLITSSESNERLIPIDAVYQTQFNDYVYVVGPNESGSPSAQIREIELGAVTGSLVEVKSGLEPESQIILNRQVKNDQWIEISEN